MDIETQSKGLKIAAAVLIGFGLLTVAGALPATQAFADLFLRMVTLQPELTAMATTETPLLLAIVGGITTGWGAMVWVLAGAPLHAAPEAVRRACLIGFTTWLIVDSVGSILSGAWANVPPNLLFYAILAWPVLRPANPRQTA